MAAVASSSSSSELTYEDILEHAMPGDDYEYRESIGCGGFGEVFKAYDTHDGSLVAIKFSKPGISPQRLEQARSEALMARKILIKTDRHANLVKQRRVYEFKDPEAACGLCACHASQLWDGGALLELVQKQPKRYLGEKRAAFAFAQLFEAVHALHNADGTGSFIHCDIKPENVFLGSAPPNDPEQCQRVHVLLGDYGEVVWVPRDEADPLARHRQRQFTGTTCYAAPEQAIREGGMYEVSRATDVWGLGASLYCVLHGRFPFGKPGKSAAERGEFRRRLQARELGPIREDLSEEVKDLLNRMLSLDPADRPSTTELLEHRWLSKRWPDAVAWARDRHTFAPRTEVTNAPKRVRKPMKLDDLPPQLHALAKVANGWTPANIKSVFAKLCSVLTPDEQAHPETARLDESKFLSFTRSLAIPRFIDRRLFAFLANEEGTVSVVDAIKHIADLSFHTDERTKLVFDMYADPESGVITPQSLAATLATCVASAEAKTMPAAPPSSLAASGSGKAASNGHSKVTSAGSHGGTSTATAATTAAAAAAAAAASSSSPSSPTAAVDATGMGMASTSSPPFACVVASPLPDLLPPLAPPLSVAQWKGLDEALRLAEGFVSNTMTVQKVIEIDGSLPFPRCGELLRIGKSAISRIDRCLDKLSAFQPSADLSELRSEACDAAAALKAWSSRLEETTTHIMGRHATAPVLSDLKDEAKSFAILCTPLAKKVRAVVDQARADAAANKLERVKREQLAYRLLRIDGAQTGSVTQEAFSAAVEKDRYLCRLFLHPNHFLGFYGTVLDAHGRMRMRGTATTTADLTGSEWWKKLHEP